MPPDLPSSDPADPTRTAKDRTTNDRMTNDRTTNDRTTNDRMTKDRLVSACRPLNALLQSGHQPGLSLLQGAFVSSILAITRLNMGNLPSGLGLEYRRQAAEAGAERWREIAELLRQGGTGQDLVRALQAYVADGGIGELRGLLDQHVRDHGLSLRTRRAQDRLDRLDEQKAAFEAELRASGRTSSNGAAPVTEQVRELLRDLRSRKTILTDLVSVLRDPATVELAPRWSVRQDVAQQAADLVMAWPQWDAIFACVHDGVVRPPSQTLRTAGIFEPDEVTELPQRLGDFEPEFISTSERLRDYARERAIMGTRRWLQSCSTTSEALQLRNKAAALLDDGAVARLTAGKLGRLWVGLGLVLDPGSQADDIVTSVARADLPYPGQPVFPLRPEQLMSWAPGAPSGDGARHFIRVVRMRSALIDSVARYALGFLDVVQSLIYQHLHARYGAIRFPGGGEQGQFIAAVLGERAGPREAPPDPAAVLAALQRPDKTAGIRG